MCIYYDDKVVLTFNYSDNHRTMTLKKIDADYSKEFVFRVQSFTKKREQCEWPRSVDNAAAVGRYRKGCEPPHRNDDQAAQSNFHKMQLTNSPWDITITLTLL